MHKTTVYLPDELKRDLARHATETKRSEAEVIREAIRAAVETRRPPAPSFGIMDSGDPFLADRVDELLEGFGSR